MSPTPAELIDEELTAYLDGELSATEAASLEQRLVDEPTLRQRLATLRKAFEMLDDLPDTPFNNSFTQSTMEMVIADVRQSIAPPASNSPITPSAIPSIRRRNWFAWPWILLTVGSMLVLGSLLGTLLAILQMRVELSQLGLFANMPGLHDAAEISVVTELAKEKEVIEYLQDRYSDRSIPLVPASLWQRRNWFRSLNPTQIAKLDSAKESLLKLPPDIQSRLDVIQNQLDARKEADVLNQTTRMIGTVLDSMPTSKRQDLEGMTTEQRTQFLRTQLCLRAAMLHAADLSASDATAIEEWSKSQLLPVLVASMPFLRRENDVRTMLMALYSQRPVEDGFRLENQDELVAELGKTLSPFAKRLLDGIDRNDQLIVISTWLVPDGLNNNARFLDAYERLRRDAREDIDLGDPNQSKRLLRERARRVGSGNRNR